MEILILLIVAVLSFCLLSSLLGIAIYAAANQSAYFDRQGLAYCIKGSAGYFAFVLGLVLLWLVFHGGIESAFTDIKTAFNFWRNDV